MRSRRVVVITLGAMILAGCGAVPSAAPKPTPPPIVILTQPQQAGEGCDAALLEGTLVADPATGLAIADARGHIQTVRWPFGYRGGASIGGALLVDDAGRVVARTGDRVRLGGGLGPDGHWYACRTITRLSG